MGILSYGPNPKVLPTPAFKHATSPPENGTVVYVANNSSYSTIYKTVPVQEPKQKFWACVDWKWTNYSNNDNASDVSSLSGYYATKNDTNGNEFVVKRMVLSNQVPARIWDLRSKCFNRWCPWAHGSPEATVFPKDGPIANTVGLLPYFDSIAIYTSADGNSEVGWGQLEPRSPSEPMTIDKYHYSGSWCVEALPQNMTLSKTIETAPHVCSLLHLEYYTYYAMQPKNPIF